MGHRCLGGGYVWDMHNLRRSDCCVCVCRVYVLIGGLVWFLGSLCCVSLWVLRVIYVAVYGRLFGSRWREITWDVSD